MQLKNMLQDLCSQGLEWRVNKDKLSFSDPNKVLTIEHKNILKENKQKVIELLLTTENDIFTSYPLSYNQLSLWFIYQEYPKNSAYNTGYALRILSPINIDIWKEAFANIMARHSSLRTRYNFEEGEIKQQVYPYLPIDLQVINVERQDQNSLVDIVKKEHQKPFSLEKDSIIRVRFFKNNESDNVLLLTIHHIATDAFSIGQVLDEAIKTYIALSKGEQPDFIPLKLNYSDFVTWQKNHLEQEGTKLLGYWKNKFQKINSILELPIDFPRPTTRTYNGNSYNFQLEAETTKQLKEFARKHNITLYSTLLAIFNVWLYKYTNQENITIGTPIIGRTDSNFQNTVGYFVNVVPIYSRCQHDISFSDFAKQVHQTTLEAMDYQDYPFALLVKNLNIDRSTSHSPIFQTMFTLQESYTLKHYLELSIPGKHVQTENLHLAYFPFTDIEGQFDLVLDAIEVDNIVYCSFKYDVDLFLTETIERWSQSFQTFVGNIVSYPSCKISELEVLTEKEKNKIIYEWNDTECDFPQDKCIHELFEEQVEKTPDAIAVVCGEEQLTYRELNDKANQLAHYLLKQGVKEEVLVGIYLERSINTIVSMLGILKAGAGYIPLDTLLPQERIKHIHEISKFTFLLCDEEKINVYLANVNICNMKKITIDASKINPKREINNTNNIYTIFTSGSTGKPKGVSVSHKSVINFTNFMKKELKIAKNDIWLAITVVTFDIANLEIYLPLLVGSKVVFAKNTTGQDPDLILKMIENEKVSFLQATPSTWKMLRDRNFTLKEVKGICGGEALSENLVVYLKENLCTSWNVYGPTETTIWSSYIKIVNNELSIGKPIDNTEIYILNNNLQPVPIGVVGEIYIGGAGLARGYINRPGSTAERFVPHPFGKKRGERLYKTGDLARYLPDGNIEFIGRKDHQVKIRGFRIELGEIEANLLEHKNIKETVVIVREDTAENKMIVAYIVVSSKENTNIEDLRNYLKNKLPEYMIPSAFVVLDKLSLTPNGKVDRKALPKPDFAIEKMVKAKTPVEEIIVNVWQKLLALENVGVEDNFFHVGGHSLLATQLVSRLSKTLQKEISIRDVFLYPTIREIAAHLEKKNRTIEKLAITKADRSQNLPLSFAQQRLWFLDKLEGASANYNMPGALKFIGKLDIAKLEKALQYIVMRHEVLRTHFIEVENGVVQVIHNDAFTLQIKENTNLEEIHSQIEIETHRPFDLGKDTLLRAIVYKVAEEDWVLFVNMHHIISDGWSIGIFMRELATLYNALQQKDTCELDTVLPALKVQYADFALWQREWLQGNVLETQLGYWQQQLANIPTMLDLPTDKPRPAIQTYNGDYIGFEIEPEITQKLQQLCNEESVTMFMCVYAAFACLLARYSNQEDIVIGTPIANRNIEETEELIGFFVNTLALRVNLANNPTFLELLKEVRTITLEAYNHQDVPFEYLVDRLAPERNMSHSPIFQVMLAWQNFVDNDLVLDSLEMEFLESSYKIAKFDMTLAVQENSGGLSGSLEYNTDLFLLETMQQFLAHFTNILSKIVEKPQQKISSLEILSKQEQQKIVYEWNNTESDFPQNRCIHELFEEQVEKTPDTVAVVCGEEQLTYRELNEKANQLAHYLLKRNCNTPFIGICIERSVEMIISILSILKLGKGYVPIDLSYPEQRIKFMVKDSKIKFVITKNKKSKFLFTIPNVEIFNLEEIDIKKYAKTNLKGSYASENAAYMIYTSGSTGNPKGAINTHIALVNRLDWMQKKYQLTKDDVVLQKTPFSFDVSVWELLWAILVGAKLVFAEPEQHKNPIYIKEIIEKEKITTIHFVPPMLDAFLNNVEKNDCMTLKRVICSGESLDYKTERTFCDKLPKVILSNLYGPTEAAIDVTYYDCEKSQVIKNCPIGKPIDNIQMYILNNTLQAVPVGVIGEIYIGGSGLARGYINRRSLTAERFVPNPFSKKEGERLYKTGDLARYLPDGNIEFIGRKDHQVKVRGFRIELGEIEANLLEHENVKETVAIVREDTAENKMIVAYIVVSDKENTDIEDLRNYLKNKLPEYMIPSAFVVLDKLPLTPNGKVDRKALPKPDFAIEKVVKAKTPVEEIIVNVWQKLLILENVGVEDNFFHVGGHSLLATQLVSRLSKTLQKEISIRDVFLYPTIREIAAHLEKKNRTIEKFAIPKADRSQNLPLSFAQQRLWFLDKLEGANANYNMPGALKLIGKLDIAKLEKALQYIVMRHEVLRTHFIEVENGAVQVIHNDAFTLQIKENTNLEEIHSQIEIETHRPFDLGKDTLLRAIVYKVAEEDWVLFVNMHHIISDGWSIGIFMRELATLYNALQQKDTCELDTVLSALKVQYADFALWQREWLQGNVLETQLGYWQQQLANIPTMLDLPTDKPRPAIQTYNGDHIGFEIEPEITQKLQQLCNEEGVTMFMCVYAAFVCLLARYSNQEDIVIGTPIANRNIEETEELIGFFVNTLVLRVNLENNPTFLELLKEVRITTLEAYNHQDVPFEYLVDRLAPERNMSHSPIFQVMLAWQNFAENDLVLNGLEIELVESTYKIAKFDITLSVQESGGRLSGSLEYNTDLFLLETMQQFLTHFKNILNEIAEKPQQKLSALEIVSKQEQQKIVHEWNNTECDFPQDKCIHELFEEQVERTPDAIAVVCGEEQLTYRELNEKANQLAHYLLKQGLKPGDYIAVIINRSQEMVISILAILKSSGVYIPLDPESPIERLTFILENAKPKIVITQKKYFSTLKNTNTKIFFVEDKNDTETTDNVVNKNVDANKPCYIIYTSGSTGLPKGSIVYHKNIISLFVSTQKSFNFSEKDTWSLFHSFAFDFSVWEMWGALLHGGKLIIVPHWISRSSSEFYSLLKKEQVTILNQTPSAFEQLSNVVDFDKTNLNVRLVIFGGEELIFQKLQKWQECFDNINFVNMYGITETTVHVSIHQINKEDLKSTKSIIGKAINLWSIYILDRFMSFVPIGVCGEIYVGGAGLAQGYINKPGLTAERFIPNLFSKKEGERLYKTGDLARYLPDGNIEFIGRKDHQVKVRGFRIELGEIEANLLEYKDIKEAVAIVREDTAENKMIVAYIVVSDKENTNIEDLRNYLKNKLPEYMVPSTFVVLDELPLTPNGKVDRKALPIPDFAIEEMVKARTPVEEIIVRVWQKLLTLENVGVEDNFFHVGGHSLLATQLVSRLNKTLQKEISIRDVFLYPTIREMATHLEKKNRTIEKLVITKVDRSQSLPLSFAQQRLWFLDKLEGASANYNMPGALKLIGKLDTAKLEKALQCIVMRHEVLRTHFIEVENGAIQVIHNDAFTLQIKENTNLKEIQRQIEIETLRPFDLSKNMLLRAIVYKVAEEEWILFVNMHHIISDGWSIGIFMRELATLYNALQQKDTCELDTVLPALKIQYADFTLWQREWLQGKVLEEQLIYWQQQLANIPTMLDLPTDKPRPTVQTYNGDHIIFEIEPQITQKLQQLCNEEGVTMFMCVYAAFACLLARYSNQQDIVIGTPIANRNIEETEELIGFFVNTLALRVNLGNNPTFLELLKEVRTTTLEAYNHQDVPFEYLVDRLAPERNMSHSPIFQVMLAWQNFAQNDLVLDNLEMDLVESSYKIAKFDMTLAVQESDGRLSGSLEYNTDLFLLETMQQFLAHFKNILSQIVEEPQQKLSTLEILGKQEQQKIVYEWNNTECDFPQDKCIHELFEEQVEKTPDAIAVVCGEEQLTYRELNEKANQLAHYLVEKNCSTPFIGVCMERSVEMIISILSILKLGKGYVPIDLSYPEQRIKFMVKDSRIKSVITKNKKSEFLFTIPNLEIFNLEEIDIKKYAKTNLKESYASENAAYMIYTSGSTGNPKGAINTHIALVNRLGWMQKKYQLTKDDVVLQKTPFSFDVSVWELLWAILVGAKLVFAEPEQHKNPIYIKEIIEKEKITTIHFVPPMLDAFLNNVEKNDCMTLERVICSGESLDYKTEKTFYEIFPKVILSNLYGPTEAAIDVTYYDCEKSQIIKNCPIGKPIDNIQMYILNNTLQAVPVGVIGEIYIGGTGLARGYINRPGLTAERFAPNPFSKKEGERIYKTGDLARYLPDGNIEFIGRKDHQVKVRGFRIELGEIEANLWEHKNVKETVVIVREDTTENKMIVAYIVVSDKENTDIEDLRSCLKNKLPEYMIPSAFVVLDKLPLTPNGKVDRKALPKPDFAIEKVVKAKTPVEEIIVNVWQKLLTLENIGVEDNFFHVGGHSLLATQLVSRLSKTLQKEISIRDVFLYPTIREMATHLEKKNRTIEKFAITKADRSQNLPLSFAQQRLWFLDKLEGASANYNMPGALKLIGKLDIEKLEKALQYIVMRHEVLHTHFVEVESGTVQVIHNDAFTLQIKENINIEEIHHRIEIETHRPFDLSKDMLLRAIVYKVAEEEWILFVNMHHIISDGWSIGIFMRELATLYNALQQKDTCELDTVLPALKIQYADFALWQREWLQGKVLEEQLGYWQQQLANIPTILDLPTDKSRPAVRTYNGDHIVFEVEPETSQKLQQLCNEEGVTMFMCVYAAFACLLARYSNQEDIVIGTPIANRNIKETEELIGFFVNTLALRVNLENNPTFLELLKEVRTTTLEAYNHQDVPFEYLVDRLAPERNMSHSPIFQVMLAWQNFAQNDLLLDGLEIELVDSTYKIAKFDMTLAVQENNGKLSGSLEYNTDLFLLETMQQFLAHFKNILSQIVEKPLQKISILEILSKQEEQKIVYEWNDTECDFLQDKCIHELFEEQVEKTPDAIAVVCGEEQLTYRELNERANQLAHYLFEQGAKEEVFIGIYLERSINTTVSMLGILKTGAAYIALDKKYPTERTTYIKKDAHVDIFITDEEKYTKERDVLIDKVNWKNYAKNNLKQKIKNKNIAYVLYTSGSTGIPKGVQIEHGSVVELIYWSAKVYEDRERENVLASTSICFDLSIFEIFCTLCLGGKITIVKDILDIDNSKGITLINTVPSAIKHLLENQSIPESVITINLAGEPLPQSLVKRIYDAKIEKVYDLYGPSEDTTYSTMCLRAKNGKESIGKVISNSQVYILSNNLQPVPIGVIGEIYIGGAGLARGYINQQDLTAERFIPNPFSKKEGVRLYKTGDLARYLPDGNMEFIGRKDHQVKVRGFRIELGEIEANLLEHKNVKETVAIVREDTTENKMIVAYIVVSDKENTNIEDLRNYLKNKLPEYMIPSAFVVLDKLPLTPNGKVDRKALPKPDFDLMRTEYEAVTTKKEKVLAEIWKKLLRLQDISRNDNFFAIGGDSIISIQLVSRAAEQGLSLSVKDVFVNQKLRDLAVAAKEKKENTFFKEGKIEGEIVLTPIMENFFEKEEDINHYNQSMLLDVDENFTLEICKKIFGEIGKSHDVLRLQFSKQKDGKYKGIFQEQISIDIVEEDYSSINNVSEKIEERCGAIQKQLDIETGKLIKVVLISTKNQKKLFIVVHHLVVDGVSWRILLNDIKTMYGQWQQHKKIEILGKTTSYQYWSQKLYEYSSSIGKKERNYWLMQTGEEIEADFAVNDSTNTYKNTNKIEVTLRRELTTKLLQNIPEKYNTQINDVLLLALALAINKWSGNNKVGILLEGHGREELFTDVDLSNTIGWFTSIFPIILEIKNTSHIENLKQVKETLRKIPQKGIGYGILKYLKKDKEIAQITEPKVLFNYLGQFDAEKNDIFSIAEERTGESIGKNRRRDTWLEMNCLVTKGVLHCTWTYNEKIHKEATIAKLAKDFIQVLETIIEDCSTAKGGFTPSDFPLADVSQNFLDSLNVEKKQIENMYSLSPMQKGILFHSSYFNEDNDIYQNQLIMKIKGNLDIDILEKAWNKVIARHDSLRSSVIDTGHDFIHIVHKNAHLAIQKHDITILNTEEQNNWQNKWLQEDEQNFFDFSVPPFIRIASIKTGNNSYTLVLSSHHIVYDGWSFANIWKEVFAAYTSIQEQKEITWKEPQRYAKYIQWLQEQDVEKGKKFWKKYLEDFEELNQLGNTSVTEGVQKEKHFTLSATATKNIQEIIHQTMCTANMVIQASWVVLLSKYTNQDDIVFGTTSAGRSFAENAEEMIGLFIHTLPARIKLDKNITFKDIVDKLKHDFTERENHSYIPLFDIQTISNVAKGSSLFESLIVFENYPIDESVNKQSLWHIKDVKALEKTNYPLTLAIFLANNQIQFKVSYLEERFEDYYIEQMIQHLGEVIAQASKNIHSKVMNVNILSEQEQNKIVYEWNNTKCDFPQDKCVHELFEEQVEKTPDAVAVVCGGEQLTYRELNEKANQLAHYLVRRNCNTPFIGICIERSVEMIISILSILKLGKGYVPIDLSYPEQRIKFMVKGSKIKFVITKNKKSKFLFTIPNVEIFNLEEIDIKKYAKTNLKGSYASENAAYMIYTSGSTGNPKGAINTHIALVNRLDWMQKKYQLTKDDVVLQKTPFSFDVSVWELLWAILVGAKLVFAEPEQHKNPIYIKEIIEKEKITTIHFVPPMLDAFLNNVEKNDCMTLKRVICSGESLDYKTERTFCDKLPKVILSNLYGPTEAAIDVTYYDCEKSQVIKNCPIGKPIDNIQMYILNNTLQAVPVGVIGEIYIGGAGLARGYINRPGLTAERFVPNPFSKKDGGRLYKTGDLARYLPDGNIEFIGRKDYQVKIRGFRIELGEIEASLLEHKNIKETVVIVREDTAENKMIVAYIVVSDKENINIEDLRNYLKNKLPEYMIPSTFVVLDKLPLTPNGKVDRKALPKPDFSSNEVMLPRNEVEAELVGIWQDVLKLEKVSIQDNFFHIGGHSLLAVQLISKINRHFQIELSLQELFKNPVIAKLSQILQYNEKREWSPVISFPSLQQTSPFFCFPGMGGTVLYLYDFLQNVSDIQPCYGLQALGFDGSSQPHGSIEEMAEYYIYYMKQIQPCGPYIVGGHSLGGKIAFEVARQLYLQGDKITKLIIIDTTPEMDMGEDYDDAQLLCDVASLYEEFYNQDLNITKEKLQCLTWSEQITQVHATFVEAGLLPNDKDSKYLENHLNIYRAQSKINYKPQKKKYPIPTILYRAQQNENTEETKISWGWEEYVDNVQVIWVPGTHITMMASENNKTIVTNWETQQEK